LPTHSKYLKHILHYVENSLLLWACIKRTYFVGNSYQTQRLVWVIMVSFSLILQNLHHIRYRLVIWKSFHIQIIKIDELHIDIIIVKTMITLTLLLVHYTHHFHFFFFRGRIDSSCVFQWKYSLRKYRNIKLFYSKSNTFLHRRILF
jgi:hypothetical protein